MTAQDLMCKALLKRPSECRYQGVVVEYTLKGQGSRATSDEDQVCGDVKQVIADIGDLPSCHDAGEPSEERPEFPHPTVNRSGRTHQDRKLSVVQGGRDHSLRIGKESYLPLKPTGKNCHAADELGTELNAGNLPRNNGGGGLRGCGIEMKDQSECQNAGRFPHNGILLRA